LAKFIRLGDGVIEPYDRDQCKEFFVPDIRPPHRYLGKFFLLPGPPKQRWIRDANFVDPPREDPSIRQKVGKRRPKRPSKKRPEFISPLPSYLPPMTDFEVSREYVRRTYFLARREFPPELLDETVVLPHDQINSSGNLPSGRCSGSTEQEQVMKKYGLAVHIVAVLDDESPLQESGVKIALKARLKREISDSTLHKALMAMKDCHLITNQRSGKDRGYRLAT
jgi:hypothetical protein